MKKSNSNPTGESKAFTFVFQNLEVILLLFTGFLVYSIYNLFTAHVSKHAVFVEAPERMTFASTLIFGLMATEIILALATSYFRKRNEWAKSFLVTAIAFTIALFNHWSIGEIFLKISDEEASEAVRLKVVLTNWLIFGLGEIISLLMNSKGNDSEETAPSWFVNFAQSNPQPQPASTLVDATGEPLKTKIGFQMSAKEPKPKPQANNLPTPQQARKPRGNSIDHDRAKELLEKGLKVSEIAQILKCTEGSIYKIKAKM